MTQQEGGCLCGRIRYRVSEQPERVSFCHCRYCQRGRGAAYAVEAIFSFEHFDLLQGDPKSYAHKSEGSGKIIQAHFCNNCGSGLYYSFERFPQILGIHAGTFDDPNWFDYSADNAKHIFLDSARRDTIIPPGLPTFRQHNARRDGTPIKPTIFTAPHPLRDWPA